MASFKSAPSSTRLKLLIFGAFLAICLFYVYCAWSSLCLENWCSLLWAGLSLAALGLLLGFLDKKIQQIEALQRQLQLRSEQLQKVNKELDNFVYTASHDLRSPLRSIVSFSEFVFEDYSDPLPEEGQKYLAIIQQESRRMMQLIDDLLRLSRLGRIQGDVEELEMNILVQSALQRLQPMVRENPQTVIHVQDDLPKVYANRVKITEVFAHLIANALKFTRDISEDPLIEIGTRQGEQGLEFFVKDNGVGIDPKFHQQVFGIFKRLNADRSFDGTGVGLSIVRRMIDSHEGHIWVESKLGEGANFVFTLPLEKPK